VNCSLCGKPMETPEEEKQAYRQVTGWVQPGKSKVWERRETGAFAHASCMVRLKLGLAVEQESLF